MEGVTREPFGETGDGAACTRFTLTNRSGMQVRAIDLGATITEVWARDRNGRLGDVVLGFDGLADYESNPPHFGSTIGRVANRIAGACFELGGVRYPLHANHGRHHLHGGRVGFDKRPWRATPCAHESGPAVRFELVSPDGDEGYPGRLEVSVTMALGHDDALRLEYEATTDAPTPVNLTHHGYWNLACTGDVLSHELTLAADAVTEVDAELIPTGRLSHVDGTALDFRRAKPVGRDLDATLTGYDHNFALEAPAARHEAPAATLTDPGSGRRLTMYTTEPGTQLYTANFLDGIRGKGGVTYGRHAGLCLEAQHFPDALHHPSFPDIVLGVGDTYRQSTTYRFEVA